MKQGTVSGATGEEQDFEFGVHENGKARFKIQRKVKR